MRFEQRAFWKGDKMRRVVRYRLLRIASAFILHTKLNPSAVVDVQVVGSAGSGTFHRLSDVDLHILFSPPKAGLSDTMLRNYLDGKQQSFNLTHDIEAFKHHVEVYGQLEDEVNFSTNAYSLLADEWLKRDASVPQRADVMAAQMGFLILAKEIAAAIEEWHDDPERLTEVMDYIKALRKQGLDRSGEMGIGNLIFKILRANGQIEALSAAKIGATDRLLSMGFEEAFEPQELWHGSHSREMAGKRGVHAGTKRAATQALEARIGIPAEGEWDGTRVYRDTLLASQRHIEAMGKYVTGINCDAPQDEDYYPTKPPTFSDGSPMPMDSKPEVFRVRVVGKMRNQRKPYSDEKANSLARRLLAKGKFDRGFSYENEGEDTGSVSVVVPHAGFLRAESVIRAAEKFFTDVDSDSECGRPEWCSHVISSKKVKPLAEPAHRAGTRRILGHGWLHRLCGW